MTSIVKHLETIGQNASVKQFDSVDEMINDINVKHPEKLNVSSISNNDLKSIHITPSDLKSIHITPSDLKSIHITPSD